MGTVGVRTSFVQAAAIGGVTQGIIPQHQNIQGVDYLETVTRRERRGTSQGVSIRVARGLYYSPRQFRSRPIEWEETVHADTGMLGLTIKHLYFAGARKRFRVRYDKIVALDSYEDGLGIMRDAQTAKPQTFRTGGWFAYDLTPNLPRSRHEPTLHKNTLEHFRPILEQKCRVNRLYSSSSREPLNDRANHNPRCREQ